MCFYTQQNAQAKNIKQRFNAEIDNEENILVSNEINGFDYLNIPIITNENSSIVSTNYNWGLLASFQKNLEYRAGSLNAKIETIHEKPSYRDITHQRCLIIATGFYDWHWHDPKGKIKTKYEVHNQDNEIFTFAGLYTKGLNPENGNVLNTFTMLTTEANEIMAYIHNHKKRMPIMLNKEDEHKWLDKNYKIENFAYPKYESRLIGFPTN